MSDKTRFSNAMNNIDILSYRAYKNLLNSGKANSPIKSAKSNLSNVKSFKNFNENRKNDDKNLTKSVFSSQTKRFTWQTDEKVNRGSELTGSIKNRRNEDFKSKKWQGLTCLVQEDKFAKYEVPNDKTPRK